MSKNYITEKEGQLDFFERYHIRYDTNNSEEVLKDSTDGIYLGGIFEFKPLINDLNKVLFQAVKYLSKERIKGHNVPANIFLVDLNKNITYTFKSKNYHKEIHTVYTGPSSKQNEGFIVRGTYLKLNLNEPKDDIEFRKLILEESYYPIDIDESCIVGWAERYYNENPKVTKDDFLKDDGELRVPDKFKNLINPYKGETNEKFKYLMDKLNDKLRKKQLGAFYTPIPYCEKAAELVREAIKRVPKGNDYIILDRCAGTGNLESVLTDDELEHCILGTYEYYEWLVLKERLEDKVMKILPDGDATFDNGFVKENDAMSEEFVNNSYIKKFIDDPKYTIIMFENPPYSEESTNASGSAKTGKQKSFVLEEMKKDTTILGKVTNELANRFIWSAYKYYVKNDENSSVILFSPAKYWKIYNISDKEYVDGFIFNRKHFHASPGSISCILWKNKNDKIRARIDNIKVYEIDDSKLIEKDEVNIVKCNETISKLYDKRSFDDDIEGSVWNGKDGYEVIGGGPKITVKSIYNKNIIASIEADAFQCNQIAVNLIRNRLYNGHDFYLRSDNYLTKLPLFVSKMSYAYRDNWYDDLYYTTSDGGTKFEKDRTFLKSCLIYTALSPFNKILSFTGSDLRDYKNEVSLDTLSNFTPQAITDLKTFKLNDTDRSIIKLWDKIMLEASKTINYNKNYTYGLYQITQELNTFTKDENNKTVYDYPNLNGDINSLKTKLKIYYKKFIEPKCFKYELLK